MFRCTIMNHSCEPNCTWSFDGKAMVIRAVTNILTDEQVLLATDLHTTFHPLFLFFFFLTKLFISYIALVESCNHRRACLLEHYAFECNCVRCRREEGIDGEVERNMATIKANEQLYKTQIGMINVLCVPGFLVLIPIKCAECNDMSGAMETASNLLALYRC